MQDDLKRAKQYSNRKTELLIIELILTLVFLFIMLRSGQLSVFRNWRKPSGLYAVYSYTFCTFALMNLSLAFSDNNVNNADYIGQ